MSRIAILGGGSWGTALAIVLSRARRKHDISLWVHDSALAESIQRDRENRTYLPGHRLAREIQVTSDIRNAVADAQIVVGAIPTAHARGVYTAAAEHVAPGTAFVSASKGLEPKTHQRMSEVIGTVIARKHDPRVAVLSGPSFAAEAAKSEPTAVLLASHDDYLASELQQEFAAPYFRLYISNDVLGVELAGAMKNVIAIAAGLCHGLGLGSNPLAALITRGLAEMSRLATALGARPETMTGLAGLGDLVATCSSPLSRNRTFGEMLGRGMAVADVTAVSTQVAEGAKSAGPILELARSHAVEMPITEVVVGVMHGRITVDESAMLLTSRSAKPERYGV